MKMFIATTFLLCCMVTAPVASAMPADHAIDRLKERGFDVQLNGGPSQGTLKQCRVLDISGLRDSNVGDEGNLKDSSKFTTARVTVTCNDTV